MLRRGRPAFDQKAATARNDAVRLDVFERNTVLLAARLTIFGHVVQGCSGSGGGQHRVVAAAALHPSMLSESSIELASIRKIGEKIQLHCMSFCAPVHAPILRPPGGDSWSTVARITGGPARQRCVQVCLETGRNTFRLRLSICCVVQTCVTRTSPDSAGRYMTVFQLLT